MVGSPERSFLEGKDNPERTNNSGFSNSEVIARVYKEIEEKTETKDIPKAQKEEKIPQKMKEFIPYEELIQKLEKKNPKILKKKKTISSFKVNNTQEVSLEIPDEVDSDNKTEESVSPKDNISEKIEEDPIEELELLSREIEKILSEEPITKEEEKKTPEEVKEDNFVWDDGGGPLENDLGLKNRQATQGYSPRYTNTSIRSSSKR
jgi:hypothetical protein